jgi:hypothetical protein
MIFSKSDVRITVPLQRAGITVEMDENEEQNVNTRRWSVKMAWEFRSMVVVAVQGAPGCITSELDWRLANKNSGHNSLLHGRGAVEAYQGSLIQTPPKKISYSMPDEFSLKCHYSFVVIRYLKGDPMV